MKRLNIGPILFLLGFGRGAFLFGVPICSSRCSQFHHTFITYALAKVGTFIYTHAHTSEMEAPLCFYLGNAQYFKKKLVMGQINVVPYIFFNAPPN